MAAIPHAAREGRKTASFELLRGQDQATGPKGGTFLVVHPTQRGAELSVPYSGKRGSIRITLWDVLADGDQSSTTLAHLLGPSRKPAGPCRETGARVAADPARCRTRGIVAKRSEEARARVDARRRLARRRTPATLGLPVPGSQVLANPDAQVDTTTGSRVRVGGGHIEIATEHYRSVTARQASRWLRRHASSGEPFARHGGLRRAVARPPGRPVAMLRIRWRRPNDDPLAIVMLAMASLEDRHRGCPGRCRGIPGRRPRWPALPLSRAHADYIIAQHGPPVALHFAGAVAPSRPRRRPLAPLPRLVDVARQSM